MNTYVWYAGMALLGLFLAGAFFGFGVWIGHGYWQARVDRKLQEDWQRWYAEHDEGKKL